MLEVHPKANSYEYYSSLITSPYVEKKQVGSSTKTVDVPLFFVGYSSSTPSDLDRHFKPLDIVMLVVVIEFAIFQERETENCEHFANMCVYGVNYSGQIYDKRGAFNATIGITGGATIGTMGGLGIFNLIGSIALAPATGGASLFLGAASTGLVGVGTAVTVDACERFSELNNNKGSTIKLTSEMSESNGKLGEKDN
ncbi:6051_t:CDS:2 [Ambispora gerdemannii]|uniref:6051_t:CDS:1 n=1 Tax=Ambispora gerdemannii TaxID=144530 RepID=A0A9N9GXE0_9GLOM|nr:6051_t:CDS:2 [Ambispora gerdemannii]